MPSPRSYLSMRAGWSPFGLSRQKPRHIREMLKVAWENRDNLRWAWKVLTKGVCDGCALGTSGVRDWTLPGTHLCMVRLELLRLNTMGAMDDALLADAALARRSSSKELRALGRLSRPLRRRRGEPGFTPVPYEEALRDIGARFAAAGPRRSAMFVTSRGVTNETYFVAQKVMRWLGSNHVDNSARLCHAPSGVALKSTVGHAATSCSYTDFFASDLIVFIGSNPANDQPVTMKYLAEARRRGARVVSVNTAKESGLDAYWIPSQPVSALLGTKICERTYLVGAGGDLPFLLGAAKVLVEAGRVDLAWIREHVDGLEELEASLRALDLAVLARQAGTSVAEIADFAAELGSAPRGILVWSMGVTQNSNGADAVRAIANLALLRGWLGKEGVGIMPIRGHSGVQGGSEMGCDPAALPGNLPLDEAGARRLSELWGFEVPAWEGMTTVESFGAALSGELDAWWCIGGNFLETMPDPARVEQALARIPLRVHCDIVATSQMLVEPADVAYILPSKTRYEQDGGGTETTTERRVVYSPELDGHQVGESRAEWRMLCDLARHAKPKDSWRVQYSCGADIRADIERSVPFYAGIAKLSRQGDQFQWGGPRLYADGRFPFPDGKARFAVLAPSIPYEGETNVACEVRESGSAPRRFRLATRRGKQFNSMIQREVDPLTGASRDHIYMHADDAAALGLRADDRIVLSNEHGRFHGRVFLAEVARGSLQGHWPELNQLLPHGRIEPEGGVPDYNAWVDVRRA
jgi:molybdopterin-dependent oxidoreductase alpha subunit